jgi:DHA1 family purine ribonucleoside efflux pump-like MFS transporter
MTEHIQPTTRPQTKEVSRPNWSAVFSVAFCVACLITVEFLPVSLLTPMAQDLGYFRRCSGAVRYRDRVCGDVRQPVYHPGDWL